MKSGALWVHCQADFGCDLCSTEIWRARRNFVFFCQVNNGRLYRFPIGQISRNLNKTRRLVLWWIPLEQNFENFPMRVAITPQHYCTDRRIVGHWYVSNATMTLCMYPSGRGPAYFGPIRWGLYSRPIALTQEGRSQVDDVCECVHDWRVRRGE